MTEQQRQAARHPFRWLFSGETETPEEIPRKELSKYTLALMGQQHEVSMAGGNWFFHFCTNVLMLKPETVGRMTGVTTMLDALNDPFIGALIDTHRFKDGRKLLPIMKIAGPICAVLSFLLFVNWNMPSTGMIVAYCTAVYILWDVCFSFQDSAIWGMTAAISPDSAQRARTVQWADIGAFLGGLLPGLLLPMLSGNGAFGLSQQQIYLLFAVFMCLGGGFQSMLVLGTTERVRTLSVDTEKQEHKVVTLLRNIGVLRHNYVLLLIMASELLRQFTPQVTDIYIFQQMTYQIGGKPIAAPVLLTILVTAFGLPTPLIKFFATKLAARAGGMKRVLIIAGISAIITRLLGFIVDIQTVPRLVIKVLLDTLNNLPGNLTNIAQRTLISDSVEYVEWKTGQRTEGITMSVKNFMFKSGWAIQRYMQGVCLTFLQYDARRVDANLPQNAHYQRWVWPMFQLGPALGLVFALIPLLILRYPDSLKQKVESEMAQRRALAAAKEELKEATHGTQ